MIKHYHDWSTEERRKKRNAKLQYLTSRDVYISCPIIAILYTHSIGNQP